MDLLRPAPDQTAAGAARDTHPDDPTWRADSLARSVHRRLTDGWPVSASDPASDAAGRSAHAPSAPELCAQVCRDLLGDFAPALILLDTADRRRVQALAACTRALWDFAIQPGTEGERLAAINRWEFALDAALAGQAPAARTESRSHPSHPVAATMAAAATPRPWPQAALDGIFAAARRRATAADGAIVLGTLAAPLIEALVAAPPSERLRTVCAALLESHGGSVPCGMGAADFAALADLPSRWRPALRFLVLTAQARATRRDGRGDRPLSALRRLGLLARARWGGA